MKNRLTDLNDHLFQQLERLAAAALKGEALADEIERSQALVSVAEQIVGNAGLQLRGLELVALHGDKLQKQLPLLQQQLPVMLGAGPANNSNGNGTNGNGTNGNGNGSRGEGAHRS